MSNFVYIPSDQGKACHWLNLDHVQLISQSLRNSGVIVIHLAGDDDSFTFEGEQAKAVLSALSPSPRLPELPVLDSARRLEARLERRGQLTEAAGGISDGEYFDRHTEGEGADA